MVADGNPVGVATEIAKDLFGARRRAAWRKRTTSSCPASGSQILEPCGITEIGCGPSQVELVLVVKLPKSVEELVAEHGVRSHGNRQQEQRVAGVDPSLAVGRQAAAGDDAMDMVMAQQVGTPGMQDRRGNPISAPSRLGSAATPPARSGSWRRTAGRRMAWEKSAPAGSSS